MSGNDDAHAMKPAGSSDSSGTGAPITAEEAIRRSAKALERAQSFVPSELGLGFYHSSGIQALATLGNGYAALAMTIIQNEVTKESRALSDLEEMPDINTGDSAPGGPEMQGPQKRYLNADDEIGDVNPTT